MFSLPVDVTTLASFPGSSSPIPRPYPYSCPFSLRAVPIVEAMAALVIME